MSNNTFTPFPVLNTERLRLRQLSVNDDKEIFALRSDTQVNKYLGRQACTTMEDARNFIQKIAETVRQNEGIYWAITLSGNDRLIGTICLFSFSPENEHAEIGYELMPAFQGQGIMQEALSKVINYGFQVIALKTIEAYTHPENTNSINLLEKALFRKQESMDDHSNNMFLVYKLSAT